MLKDKPVCASEAAGNACYNTGKGQNDSVGSFDYYQRSRWALFPAPPENNKTAVKNIKNIHSNKLLKIPPNISSISAARCRAKTTVTFTKATTLISSKFIDKLYETHDLNHSKKSGAKLSFS